MVGLFLSCRCGLVERSTWSWHWHVKKGALTQVSGASGTPNLRICGLRQLTANGESPACAGSAASSPAPKQDLLGTVGGGLGKIEWLAAGA